MGQIQVCLHPTDYLTAFAYSRNIISAESRLFVGIESIMCKILRVAMLSLSPNTT